MHGFSLAVVRQVLLAVVASLGHLTTGLSRGWSASAVPSITSTRTDILTNEEQASWVTAIIALGATIGSLFAGPLLYKLGRKRTLQFAAPVMVCGWLIIGFSVNLPMMLCGRILVGSMIGVAFPAAQIYISECSRPAIRGLLGSFPPLFLSSGILISYVFGIWLPWNYLAFASAVFPVLLFILIIPFPESPPWLLLSGKSEEAIKALEWLTDEEGTNLPLEPINSSTANENQPQNAETPAGKKILDSPYLTRSALLPFVTSASLFIFQNLTGIDSIIFNAVEILHTSKVAIDDHLAAVIVGVVQVLATMVSFFIIDKTGRKPLLYVSGLLSAVSMAALGTFFYFDSRGETEDLGALPLVSLSMFMIGFSIGLANVPNVLFGEILPEQQRSALSATTGVLHFGILFLVVKTYSNIKSQVGSEGVFWMYASFSLLSCVFVRLFVPETKGKTLKEIEDFFKRR